MTITRKRVTKRQPESAGTILREEFIEPYGLTQEQLATAMGVTRTFVNELVNDRRGITIDTAIMLSKVFKNTPQFWLNIYLDNQLWEAFHNPKKMARFKRVVCIDKLPHRTAA